jgi:hypothetical protein
MHTTRPFEVDGKWYYDHVVNGDRDRYGPFKSSSGAEQSRTKFERRKQRNQRRLDAVARGAGLPAFDGTLRWWSEVLAAKARDVHAGAGEMACKELSALASAAKAAHAIHDTTQLERDVKELQEYRDQMKQLNRHGLRATRAG